MSRIRYLKPDFFKDEDLGSLPYETRLFYAGLWCMADKSGRLEDRPQRLKAEIFPYDKVDAEKCLQQLSKPKAGSGQPFIHRYITQGQRYIQIVTWTKHQRPHHTEKESTIPPAPPLTEKGTEKGKGNQLKASAELSNRDVTVKQPLRGAEKGTEKGKASAATALFRSRAPTATPPTASPLPTPPTNLGPGEREQEAVRLSQLMFDLICRLKPDFKEPRLKTWTRDFDRVLRLDKRPAGRIEAVMRWSLSDEFWQANILSPQKLRQHYDRLEIAMGRSRAGKNNSEGDKVCVVDRAEGKVFQVDRTGKRVWLCDPCHKAFERSGRADFGTLSPAVLENIVLKFKAQSAR